MSDIISWNANIEMDKVEANTLILFRHGTTKEGEIEICHVVSDGKSLVCLSGHNGWAKPLSMFTANGTLSFPDGKIGGVVLRTAKITLPDSEIEGWR
jgi:hypothetical protein